MSRAISIIKQEHLNYLALLQCLGHLADEARESRSAPDLTLFHNIVDYIESFLNRFHHPNEDDYLFRALLLRGIAWSGRASVDRFNDLVTLDARVE